MRLLLIAIQMVVIATLLTDRQPDRFLLNGANVSGLDSACDERGFKSLEIFRRGAFQQITGECIDGNKVVVSADPRKTIADPEAPYKQSPGDLGWLR